MLKKAIIKSSVFVLLLVLILSLLNPIFVLKLEHRRKLYQGLYRETEAPFDVVLLGSSHMHSGINPNVLWDKYGITSFNYGTGGQPINVTYYLLKEVLKKHKNPLVVVDLYYLGYNETYGKSGYIRYVLDSMKTSMNKAEAVVNCTPKSYWITYIFPFLRFHTRWKELSQEDFYYDYEKNYYTKGFAATQDIYGKDNESNPYTTEKAELPPESKEYLMKIIELSKEENFKLVFINVPYDSTITDAAPSWTQDSRGMFNTVSEIAKENNIPFIDYNKKIDELGFDFKADMANADHMSLWGANKVSELLGKYLVESYPLTDHRNDEKYSKWKDEYTYYVQEEALTTLRAARYVKDYVPLVQNENYTLIALSDNYSSLKNDPGLKESLMQLGLKLEEKATESHYMAVINNGKVESEEYGESKLNKTLTLENNIKLDAATSTASNNMPGLVFNNKDYSNRYHGFNLVVYDKVLQTVIDSVYLEDNHKVKR